MSTDNSSVDELVNAEDTIIMVQGTAIPRQFDASLEEDAQRLQHQLLVAEIMALRDTLQGVEVTAVDETVGETVDETVDETATEAATSAIQPELVQLLQTGPYVSLPPSHPHHALNNVCLQLEDWAASIPCEYGASHRNPNACFPHVLTFSATGAPKYTIETNRVNTKLNIRFCSKIPINDLCHHAAALSASLAGPGGSSLNIQFECFVISDVERHGPFIPNYDEHGPTLEQWPVCRLERRGWDLSKPCFLQDAQGLPQRRALSTLTRSGSLNFQIYFRDKVWSKRCNKAQCNGMIRFGIRPTNPYLAQLKGWSMCTPPFLLASRKRERGAATGK